MTFRGFSQKYPTSAQGLSEKVLPVQVKVYREGQFKKILARELVLGDLVPLEEGDRRSGEIFNCFLG